MITLKIAEKSIIFCVKAILNCGNAKHGVVHGK